MWVLSLVMSLAIVLWWVRSHFRGDLLGRHLDVVEEHDELDREWFVYSDYGRLKYGSNWTQRRFDSRERQLKSRRDWHHLSFPPDHNAARPAYFPLNRVTPNSRNRMRGFNIGIISIGHSTATSWWRNDWSNRSSWGLNVPHWLVASVFLILPAIALWRRTKVRLRRRLVENRQCAHCGYDLRASGKCCPECGKPVEVAAVKVSS